MSRYIRIHAGSIQSRTASASTPTSPPTKMLENNDCDTTTLCDAASTSPHPPRRLGTRTHPEPKPQEPQTAPTFSTVTTMVNLNVATTSTPQRTTEEQRDARNDQHGLCLPSESDPHSDQPQPIRCELAHVDLGPHRPSVGSMGERHPPSPPLDAVSWGAREASGRGETLEHHAERRGMTTRAHRQGRFAFHDSAPLEPYASPPPNPGLVPSLPLFGLGLPTPTAGDDTRTDYENANEGNDDTRDGERTRHNLDETLSHRYDDSYGNISEPQATLPHSALAQHAQDSRRCSGTLSSPKGTTPADMCDNIGYIYIYIYIYKNIYTDELSCDCRFARRAKQICVLHGGVCCGGWDQMDNGKLKPFSDSTDSSDSDSIANHGKGEDSNSDSQPFTKFAHLDIVTGVGVSTSTVSAGRTTPRAQGAYVRPSTTEPVHRMETPLTSSQHEQWRANLDTDHLRQSCYGRHNGYAPQPFGVELATTSSIQRNIDARNSGRKRGHQQMPRLPYSPAAPQLLNDGGNVREMIPSKKMQNKTTVQQAADIHADANYVHSA